MRKTISNSFTVTTIYDPSDVRTNILLRTVFDNGLDFIHEKWDATEWGWVSMDSSQDTQYIEGRQSIRIVVPAGSGNETMFYQSVLGKLKPDTWYTISWYDFASKGYTFCIHNIINNVYTSLYADSKVIVDGVEYSGTNDHNDVPISAAWEGKRHYITFKTKPVVEGVSPISTTNLNLGWYFINDSGSVAQNFVLCMPKLEEGDSPTAYIANEDDLIGEQGEQGDSIREVSIYKWAGTQPQKPTSTDIPPSGWTLKPYPSWHFEGVADSAKSVVRIPITTTVANATVTLKAVAHSEEEYDFVVLGDLDSTALETDTAIAISEACQESSSAYGAYTSGDGGVATRQYTIATAGSHFICIAYAKDSSNSGYGDYADVEMTQFSEKLWKCVGTAVNDVLTSDGWSTPIQENGIDGERGKVGRFFYYAQVWSDSSAVSYLVSDAQAPFFSYNNNYWVFNPEVNGTYTMAQMGEPSSQSANWQIMTNDFKYLITEAIFGQYAHFGGLIINGDWMLSEYGMRNGSESTAYTYFDVSFPKGSMVLANNVTLDLDEDDYPIEQQFPQWLEAGRSYIFTIVVNNSTTDEAKIELNGDTYTAQGTTSFTFEPSTSMTYVLSAETLETHSVNISISIVLEDAFIPNYAVDMRRGKTYIQNADVSGNVEAAKIVAANEDMITTIQAGVLKVSSTKSASYGIFSINSLNEVILQMYDKDGKLVTSLGGSPTYFVSGKWTQYRWKSLGTTLPAVATTANYTAYDSQCSNYYELTLGKQMDNSGNILNYYLPDNSSPLPQGDSRIAEDGKTFRSHTINSSYYIPEGYYIAPNNGNFPQLINPKTGETKAFASVLHYKNGIIEYTQIIELSEVRN